MKPAVFLDRDGTINEEMGYINHLSRFQLLPASAPAIARLNQAGLLVVVATNQSGVARQYFPASLIDQVHDLMGRLLAAQGAFVDAIYVCQHGPEAGCACRKPKPGLIEEAARRHALDPARSFLIGDRWRDIDAGHAAGCTCLLIDYGYRERAPSAAPAARVHSLAEAAEWILERTGTDPPAGREQPSRNAPDPTLPALAKPVTENGDRT